MLSVPPIAAFLLAQAANPAGIGWEGALVNYGALGLWVLWMLYRDKRESEKQDKRHEENLAAQKAIEKAFRTNTTSIIVVLSKLKNLDTTSLDILERIKADNADS